ncbi:MAG: hypothetical protein HYY01_14810 [Chloroflexi bacterium]|nr:hypothetical protein [Chloroflexota bacterium]
MKTVRFTAYALLKLEVLQSHGVRIDAEIVEDVIRRPDRTERGYGG